MRQKKFEQKKQEIADVMPDVEKQPSEINKTVSDVKKEFKKSPVVLRKLGQSPILFARARLGLSEGSGIGALQRQGAAQSPTSQRRAKSLDASVISFHRLPPANAFSSKDDTVDLTEEAENKERESENVEKNLLTKQQSIIVENSLNHQYDSTGHHYARNFD